MRQLINVYIKACNKLVHCRRTGEISFISKSAHTDHLSLSDLTAEHYVGTSNV